MRPKPEQAYEYQAPSLLKYANMLANELQTLSDDDIKTGMKLSDDMTKKTKQIIHEWSANPAIQRPAIDTFLGDIYSGLQVQTLSTTDRAYANTHLYILSGLYGVLRALDSIYPYRFEMGYRLNTMSLSNLYDYWNSLIADTLSDDSLVVNLAAAEYSKAVITHLKNRSIITPKFMTINPKTHVPSFVVVHAKIARGAFAHWLITNRIESVEQVTKFNKLGYTYSPENSTPNEPVYICESFKGLGLSVRLS